MAPANSAADSHVGMNCSSPVSGMGSGDGGPVAADGAFSLALKSDGSVAAWGGISSQLGNALLHSR